MGFGCVCDNKIDMSKQIDEKFCSMTCADGSEHICGGKITLNVYEVLINLSF